MGLAVAKHGHGKDASVIGGLGNVLVHVLRIQADIGHVDDAARQDGALGGAAAAWPARVRGAKGSGAFGSIFWKAPMWMSSPSNLKMALNRASHRRSALAAMVSNTGCTSVGDRLITCRISLVAVCCSSASLRGVEQPHVLDGDRRLRGEGLDEGHLVGREQSGLAAVENDGAVRVAFAHQRNGEDRTKSSLSFAFSRASGYSLSSSGTMSA